MPQIRSKQIKGDTPINPNDIANKQYVDDALLNANGKLTIEDEGVQITTSATTINFIGSDVLAEVDSNGNYRVNVYIPTPEYSPYFNTITANGDARVPSISTTNRYIASPTTEGNPYKIGNWSGGTTHNSIRNSVSVLTYTTNGVFSLINEATTFTVNVYDADNSTILSTNNITIDSNKTNTINNISITTSSYSSDADKYKSSISIVININTILPNGGRFSVEMIHDNSTDGTYTFTQNNIFKDNEILTTNMSGNITILPNVPVIKTISGVEFYTLNTEWNAYANGINNINSNSYPISQQVRINDNNFFISEILNIHGNNVAYYHFDTNTWSTIYNTSGSTFNKTDWTTDQANYINWSHVNGAILDTNINLITYDWSQISQTNSQNYNYLIDTLVDDSDRNSERFRSENDASYPRLQNDLATDWINTQSLINNDGLQILGDRLVYPQYNFKNYLPNQVTDNIDYTTINTDRTYIRKFDTNNSLSVGNGKIIFTDHNISENDIQNDIVKIELTIDNGIKWLTFKGQFGLFADSCRVYIDSYGLIGNPDINNSSMAFTFGNPPNNYSDHIILKITFTYTGINKYIGGIDILNNEIDGGNEWA